MFRGLAQIFVNGFGITRPAPEKEEHTGMIIAVVLLLLAAMLALGVFMLAKWLG